MTARKFFLSFLSISIISCAVSVSISQGFLVLSFLVLLFSPKEKWEINRIFLISLLFWLGEFFIFIIHFSFSNFDLSYLKIALNAELKDFFLYLAFICMMNLKKSELPQMRQSIHAFAFMLIITGFISIFSEFRLGWLIASISRTMTSWAYQHNYFRLGIFSINLPIGLMNTHLTYGGLLMFVYPWIFFQGFQDLFSKKRLITKLLSISLLIIASIVFVLNNARSAMGGALVSIALGFLIWYFRGMKFPISKRILFSALVILVLFVSLLSLPSEPAKRILTPLLGADKHTDSGRSFIWNSTWSLIQNQPILGIGPGNYSKEIEVARKKLSLKYDELAFFYETTQRGHAHNDYLHLWVTFGFLILFLYLILAYFLVQALLVSQLPFIELALYLGLGGFFAAGLLQCYFQDDEVVIFFWMLFGMFTRSNQLNQSNEDIA
ncbi:MAG: O-antigen ligase family protein [Leptospiraceae bacterium]|nr:O-antigen ligase family protein [Leptospiraceae bacterium]MCZ8346404.1 O-antigen ligase family protein [Leptospiraceae bacterium]